VAFAPQTIERSFAGEKPARGHSVDLGVERFGFDGVALKQVRESRIVERVRPSRRQLVGAIE
jgi:hypothetical protein